MLAPSLLANLIAHLSLVVADLRCHAGLHSAHSNVPRDQLENDCRQLVVHIPSSSRGTGGFVTYGPRLPPSSPFYPQASLHHKSCVITISYHRNRRTPIDNNATLGGMSTFLYADSKYQTPPMDLFESTVFVIWEEAKQAAFRVVEQCVAKGHTGVEWNPLDILELHDAWYMVDVRVVATNGMWSRMARMDAPRALNSRVAPGYKWIKNMFRETFYDA